MAFSPRDFEGSMFLSVGAPNILMKVRISRHRYSFFIRMWENLPGEEGKLMSSTFVGILDVHGLYPMEHPLESLQRIVDLCLWFIQPAR